MEKKWAKLNETMVIQTEKAQCLEFGTKISVWSLAFHNLISSISELWKFFILSCSMITKSKHSSSRPEDSGFIWNTKKKKKSGNQFPVAAFIKDNYRKLEEAAAGPGAGAGIGCGIGLGMGLVGGLGYGSLSWINPKLVFGVGMGCGIGLGFGYGRGIGYGRSFEAMELDSNKSTRKRG